MIFFTLIALFTRYTKKMKKKKLLHIAIINTLLFFSACSNKEDNLKKKIKPQKVSVYNLMGISEPIKNNYRERREETSVQDIEYISYRHNTPREVAPRQNPYQIIKNIEYRAKSFLGVPYVWGATGPNKFDCSGFTQWVYRDVGINIPRVSRDQARVGEFVSFNELQAGDMMFFDTHKKRTGRVSHVGIYLGSGNFIHASSAGKKVVIYNFYEKPFYKKRFLWGRRVVNNNFHYASN